MKIAVYLDTDCNGNDLLDSVGNNVTAGWYLIDWPNGEIGDAMNQVPFEHEQDAVKAGWVGDDEPGPRLGKATQFFNRFGFWPEQDPKHAQSLGWEG